MHFTKTRDFLGRTKYMCITDDLIGVDIVEISDLKNRLYGKYYVVFSFSTHNYNTLWDRIGFDKLEQAKQFAKDYLED